jgi:transcriptional regulator with XRE-family HTH domain
MMLHRKKASVHMAKHAQEQGQPSPNASTKPEDAGKIGPRIRQLRTDRGLALRNLAESSGLSINTISLVERNKISPSVSTLQRIAAALDVPITSFFEEETDPQSIIFSAADQRRAIAIPAGQMEKLATGLPHQCIEPLLLNLDPGATSGSAPIIHSGHELIYCIKGTLFYEIAGERYELQAGDSLLFEARMPHRWGNNGSTQASLLMIFARPDGTDGILQRHLHH